MRSPITRQLFNATPTNADAIFNRARTHYHLGNLEATISDYSRVVELTPDDGEAFNNRGLALDALGDYQALAPLRTTSERWRYAPNFAEARSNRGAALEASGQVDAALKEYLAALDTTPEFAAAHYNAARLYARTGDIDRSGQHLENAISLAPQFWDEASTDDELSWVLQTSPAKRPTE